MLLTNNKNYKDIARRKHLVQLKSDVDAPAIRVSSPPKDGEQSSDINERVPEEMEEVRKEQMGSDSDDEEDNQVYSEMLQRINSEVAALQVEEE